MALTSGSKILVSDISTALGGKIDTAGTGLSKDGTTLALASLHSAASTIGSSSAQTLAYSGTFTIPYVSYDVHGRVSGGGTRTLTMPAAPSGGTATAVSGVAVAIKLGTHTKLTSSYGGITATCNGTQITSLKLPSGGRWRWAETKNMTVGEAAGGSNIISDIGSGESVIELIAIRIS